MKSALLISLTLHVAITLALTSFVRIRHVEFVPREVYSVRLVTPAEASKPKPQVVKKKEPPPPVEKEEPPPPKPEPKDDFVPPPEKPKPKPKPKPEAKKVPTTEIEKTIEPDSLLAEADDEAAEPVPETGSVSLDAEHFPFGYYIVTMKRKIAAFWQVPGAPRETLHCVVYFQVLRNGAIGTPSVEFSSGNIVFDQAALRSVVRANPLPPLPDGFTDDYLGVHFSFTFRSPNDR